jgi:hypothetical protein
MAGIFVGDIPPTEIYVGNTPVAGVYVGDEQVWPVGPFFRVESTTIAGRTTDGTLNITIPDFGEVNAVIIRTVGQGANGAITGGGIQSEYGKGFATNQGAVIQQCCYGTTCADGNSSQNNFTGWSGTTAMVMFDTGGGLDANAAVSAFITDGITLNYTASQSPHTLMVTFFGSLEDAFCALTSLDNEITPVSITGVGFEADVIMFASNGQSSSGVADGAALYGAAINDGSETQASTGVFALDGAATMDNASVTTNDSFLALPNTGGTSVDWKTTLQSFDADGFTFIASDSPGNARSCILYLKLPTGTPFGIVDMEYPTGAGVTTGTDSFGFQPLWATVGSIGAILPAQRNINQRDSNAGDTIYAHHDVIIDAAQMLAASTSNENTASDSTASQLWTDGTGDFLLGSAGLATYTVSGYTITATGFTITMTASTATAGWGLAIGSAP